MRFSSEVQPWRGQTYCILCNGDQNGIPVRCGDPEFIHVAEGYFRPAGLHPGLSLDQTDVPCQSDSLTVSCPTNDTYIDFDQKPVMAVPCPWGKASCRGGRDHGDASCADGHEGLFCASCSIKVECGQRLAPGRRAMLRSLQETRVPWALTCCLEARAGGGSDSRAMCKLLMSNTGSPFTTTSPSMVGGASGR